ncbi:MAG: quinone-dependent dihydroorotate dehydrogenase [Propionibacteriaceae bacterium]
MIGYRRVVRPLLFRYGGGDAERVHEATLRVIAATGSTTPGRRLLSMISSRPRTPVTVAGVDFPGLVGLAAGMDKDGVAVASWAALGFAHAELGTVTAHPQPGNDRPRLVRLPASGGLVNRMGFNNAGATALASRLAAAGVRRGNGAVGMPLGISIGKTKITPLAEATQDYLTSLRLLTPYADYVAVNVSSPNTAGLRSLQDAETLAELVRALVAAADGVPIFVKIAPDLAPGALDEVVGVAEDNGAGGLVVANTTLSRDGVRADERVLADQAGGLSGAPLTRRARGVVGRVAARSRLPVIGVGGVMTAADAQALLDLGARLVQVYTGYVFAGPELVSAINRHCRPWPRPQPSPDPQETT